MQQLVNPGAAVAGLQGVDGRGLQDTQLQASSGATTADAVLQAIVETGGNIPLAGERLHEQLPHIFPTRPSAAQLAFHLQGHENELKERMELVQLLNMLSLMPQLQKTMAASLTDLTGADAVRAYTEISNLIQRSVKKDEMTLNINDMRWKLLPRGIAQTFAELEASGQLEKVLMLEGEYKELDEAS